MFGVYLFATLVFPLAVCSAQIVQREITQPLDHFAATESSALRFSQKYYVSSRHYKAGGPAFLYSVGERAAHEQDIESGWISELAHSTSGLVVLLEQRFYGSSKPDTTSNLDDVLKYLTVEQMMSDIYRFVNAVDIPELHKQKRNVSWVLVGGSFAGSLMAWTKYKYRDLDVAVIASSAPMQIKDGYWEFDKVVMQRLPCAASVSHAVQEVDEVLRSQNITQIGSLKRDFGLGSIRSTEDFASALTVQISSMMQKPAATEDIQDQIHDFCAHFTQQQQPNGHFSLEQLQSATRQFIQTQGALSPDSCPKGDDLVWFWQQCTELGLWQTAPPASSHWSQHRLRSEHLSVGYFQSECRRCIPESTSNSIAESKREFRSFAAHALDSYLAENESGSTLFTVGELDPWRYLAVPVDNRSNSSSNNILVIRGASHAEDLIGSRGGIQNMEIEHAHSQMISMVERWLKQRRRRLRGLHTASSLPSILRASMAKTTQQLLLLSLLTTM